MRKSLTIVELLVGSILLGVIILGASNFHLASDSFLRSTETRTEVLNELTFVIEHLNKNIALGAGTLDNPGIEFVGGTLTIDQLTVVGGVIGTRRVSYDFDNVTHEISFTSGAMTTVLTDKYISLAATPLNVRAGFVAANGGVAISNLALVFDPGTYDPLNPDERYNPLVSTVDAGGRTTLYFYPLAHSWN